MQQQVTQHVFAMGCEMPSIRGDVKRIQTGRTVSARAAARGKVLMRSAPESRCPAQGLH
jgi:hypothetical protein